VAESCAAVIRVVALALWGVVLLQSSLSGRLDLLLRGVFHPLVALSGVLLLLLAALQLPRGGWRLRERLPWPWLLSSGMALAVLLLPPNPSFSQLAANRPAQLEVEPALDFLLPPAQRSLTDWVRLLRSQPDPELYAGDPVRISGFVLTEPGQPPQLARLLVRCCLADATPVGLPVQWPAGFRPRADQWLALQGRMGVERLAGGQTRSVVIAERLQPIPRPQRPLEP
jgi:uncharacterized repeat protein (TIGR03943 family)